MSNVRPNLAASLIVAILFTLVGRELRAESTAPTGPIPSSTVGLPVTVTDLVLPGSALEPIPLDDDSPVVIRIDAVRPHGTDHRYDLVVSALEPGTFDLRDHLRRKDGSPVEGLPELTFEVASLLPPGQIEPHRPERGELPWYWDYRIVLSVLTGLWVAGLVALLRLGRKRRRRDDAEEIAARPVSLADRLRPLVTAATEGRADSKKLAELERALIAFWRRRANMQDVPFTETMSRLRAHPEAGPLLGRIEAWLHQPPPAEAVDPTQRAIEVAALLAPYASLPPDALEGGDLPGVGAVSNHVESSPRAEAVNRS